MEKTYSISEAANLTDTTPTTLRYYEDIGLLVDIARNESGYRAYTKLDLAWIDWLRMLRDSGMGIQQMITFVQLVRSEDDNLDERCEILDSHRQHLRERIAVLQGYLTRLDNKAAYYRNMMNQQQEQD